MPPNRLETALPIQYRTARYLRPMASILASSKQLWDSRSHAAARSYRKIHTENRGRCCTRYAQPRRVFRLPEVVLHPAGILPKAYPFDRGRLGLGPGAENHLPAMQ